MAVLPLPAGLGIASVLMALLVRVLFTYVCALCAGFNLKEKAFIALAWMPKATVQACARSFKVVLLDFFFFFFSLSLEEKLFYWSSSSSSGSHRLHGFRHGPE